MHIGGSDLYSSLHTLRDGLPHTFSTRHKLYNTPILDSVRTSQFAGNRLDHFRDSLLENSGAILERLATLAGHEDADQQVTG
jgi:hypothetical protein